MQTTIRLFLLLLAWSALLPSSTYAQGTAFSCDGVFYQIKQPSGSTTSYLYTVDRSNSTYSTTALNVVNSGTSNATNNLGVLLNGLAYNSQDGYMYALTTPGVSGGNANTALYLYKIGQGGIGQVSSTAITVAGSNLGITVASGTFDKSGNYYFSAQNTGGTADYSVYRLQPASSTPTVATKLTPSANQTMYDLAFNPTNGLLYGASFVGSLYQFNPSTSALTTIATTTQTGAANAIGTAFFDVAGNMYAYSNGTVGTAGSAKFYSVNLTSGAYTQISTIDAASVSDGASCINPGNSIDMTKTLTNMKAVNAYTFDISYAIRVRNTYTVTLSNVQVSDILKGNVTTSTSTPFPSASSVAITAGPVVTSSNGATLAANPNFNGLSAATTGSLGGGALLDGTQSLTAGQQALITYTVRVTYANASSVPTTARNNTAYATSTSSSPNKGYTLTSSDVLLTPNNLVANDASTNSANFPASRTTTTNGTPDAVDSPSPTPVTFPPSISGIVFEDVNYGGGLGRSQNTSSGVGRSGATVELYTGSGTSATYTSSTTTASDGSYYFTGLTAGSSYVVRVVNSTVTSSRNTNNATGLLGIQTYRTSVDANGTTADLNRVGGEAPQLVDAGTGTTGNTLATLTTSTTTAESLANIALSANNAPAVNVSFGYNFDAVVNTADAGQGSLRQFITNSNALVGESSLAPVYTNSAGTTTALSTAGNMGVERSIFMIPNGTAVAGQVAGLTNGFSTTTGGTAAIITLASALPAVTGTSTAIDGRTQTTSTGDTNAAATTAAAESTGPEVVLNLNNLTGLAFSGANERLSGLGITGSASASSGVLVNSTATGLTMRSNTIYGNGVNVSLLGSATGTIISNNVIRSSTLTNGGGIVAQSGTSNNTFSQNTFDSNTGLAIDLTNGTTTIGDGVTINDLNDADTGANGLLNFPILTKATLNGTNLVVNGYAQPGSLVELYLAAADPTNFGEGQLYLTNFTQGTAAGTTGNVVTGAAATYGPGTINGLSQGTDNTNSFTATIPLSSLTAAQLTALQGAAILTSTSTLNSNTSEFSGNLVLVADVTVSLAGPATLNAGQPTGNFTATFTNEGPSAASNVTRTVTLPTGASITSAQLANINATATTTGSGSSLVTTIDFGPVASLVANASSVVTFAFIAPSAVSTTLTLTGTTSTAVSEGTNVAPNQASLTLKTVETADVVATITGATTVSSGTATGTFTATFTNVGAQTAAGIVRTVQLPKGLTGVTITGNDASSYSYSSTTGLISLNSGATTTTSLAAGSSLTWTISLPVANNMGAQVAATANVSTTTNEAGLTSNNTATAVLPSAFDLTTTLTGPTATVPPGSPTALYVTTTNNGPNAAPTAVQTVTIPSSAPLTNVFITNGGTYQYNINNKAGVVTFPSATNLPSGQTITNSISFNAPADTFAPVATVTPNTTADGETNTNNNTAYLNGATSTTDASANLVVKTPTNTNKANEATTIMASATIVDAGATVTYTVTATNNGPTTATSVVERVQLLPGLTISTLKVGSATGTLNTSTNVITFGTTGTTATYSTTTGVLTYATVNSQDSGPTPLTFATIAVTTPTAIGNGGQLLATATVSTALIDPVPADNVASVVVKVRTTADLVTTITGPSSTVAGLTAKYTVTFANNGPSDATTVVGTVQLPAGLGVNNVSVADPSGYVVSNPYDNSTGLVTLPTVANAPAGASQVYTIALTAPGQNFSVSSAIASGTNDTNGSNNSATLSTTVSTNSDVTINVSGPATTVSGNTVTYNVTTTNNGPSAATTVVPTIQLPTGLTLANVVGGSASNYNLTTGLLTFNTVGNLAPGESQVAQVSFPMPSSPSNGYITGRASVVSASNDANMSNNSSSVTTSVAPTTTETADLLTSITSSATTVGAGSSLTYTVKFQNTSTTTAAANVLPVAYLPAGLTGVVVTNSDNGTAVPGAYNSATGQVTFPTIPSQAANNVATYTITLTAPAGNTTTVATSAVSTATTDPGVSANYANAVVNITNSYDITTTLVGPASALPSSNSIYTVTTLNGGPSTTMAATTQTVTLPSGVTATNISGGGTQSGTTITWTIPTGQPAGASNEVVNTFSVVMPTSGSLALTAQVTSTGESSSATLTNTATLTTTPANIAPVAQNVWNTLQSSRGNTANLAAPSGLAISPLNATDSDGNISSSTGYTIVALPSGNQGTLYYKGAPVATGQTVGPTGLTFAPFSGYVGDATFTYLATDNSSAVSNVALYTIPVAQDQSTTYTVYNTGKGGSNKYVTNDVLAQVIDPNTATYTSSSIIYDPNTGALQNTASNGLATTGTNATLASGTLPTGVSLDAATGRIYVSDASQLVNYSTVKTYIVTVMTTDINGGTNTVPVTLTIGAYPLPVVLVAFSAQAVQNRDGLLTWSTASEQNNDHFDVERSLDGTTFSKLSQVAGHGTTSAASAYTFTDAGIGAKASGPVYYRLRQVDVDGTSTYSPVRSVSFTAATLVSVSLYPNPAQASTGLDLSQLPTTGTYQVQLLDATGRSIRSWSLGGGQVQPLDVQQLATGTYLLLVTGQQPGGAALKQTLRLTKD